MGSIIGSPDNTANVEATIARLTEQQRQDRIRAGTERINGMFGQNFGDGFFTGRRDAYVNYAAPQLEQQYGDARKALTFALARGGNLNSSTRGAKFAELEQLYDLNKQKIADQGLSYETQARGAVEDARADLLQTLNATGDADGAVNAAIARSQALSQPVAFNPMEQLFASFTSGLGQQAAQERAAAASGGSYTPRYDTGLFGNRGRVTVKR